MYTLCIRLCGKNVRASVNYESTIEFCSLYLADFDTPDVEISVPLADVLSEQLKLDRERELEGLPRIIANKGELETLALYRRIAEAFIDYGIILFHGSAIAVDGVTYLFTAKSGTGKSTHTRLWRQHFGDRAIMVNDDKPLIEIGDDSVTIHGTPWNGKHKLGNNISLPLSSICILERGKENSIQRVDGMAEFPKILSQTYRNKDAVFMKKTLALLVKMLKNVNVYRLFCNMNPEAAIISYNGMKGQSNEIKQ